MEQAFLAALVVCDDFNQNLADNVLADKLALRLRLAGQTKKPRYPKMR